MKSAKDSVSCLQEIADAKKDYYGESISSREKADIASPRFVLDSKSGRFRKIIVDYTSRSSSDLEDEKYWEDGTKWTEYEYAEPLSRASGKRRKRRTVQKQSKLTQPETHTCWFLPCLPRPPWATTGDNSLFADVNDGYYDDFDDDSDEYYDEDEEFLQGLENFSSEKLLEEDSLAYSSTTTSPFLHQRRLSEILAEMTSSSSRLSSNGSRSRAGSNSPYQREGGILQKSKLFRQKMLGLEYYKQESYRPSSYRPREQSYVSSASEGDLESDADFLLKVRFLPVTTVVPIRSWREMSPAELSQVWWQMEDFEYFKSEVTLLTKPTEEPNTAQFLLEPDTITTTSMMSAPWFTNQITMGTATNKKIKRAHPIAIPTQPPPPPPRAVTSSTGRDSEKNNHNHNHTSTANAAAAASSVGADTTMSDEKSDKDSLWWHKYGDSRRGLEKIVIPNQDKEVTTQTKIAIRQVLLEQSHMNADQLAHMYHEYTAWARDLALAAGASDADAVRTDFNDAKRKSREFFLLKQVFKHDHKIHKHTPDFMIPKGFTPKGYLEE